MTKRLNVVILALVLGATALYASKGKVRIASDHQGAYVYVDGKKKAMTGEGFTSILLEEGEYTIKIAKPENKMTEYAQTKSVFVGEESSVKLSFKLKKTFTEASKKKFAQRWKRRRDTVADTHTGLQWQDNESLKKPWLNKTNYKKCENGNKVACDDTSGDTATTYCKNLVLDGHSDWRVPSLDELRTLVVCSSGEQDPIVWKNVKYGKPADGWSSRGRCIGNFVKPSIVPLFLTRNASDRHFWSDTTFVGLSTHKWGVDSSNGRINGNFKEDSSYVRCVRVRE